MVKDSSLLVISLSLLTSIVSSTDIDRFILGGRSECRYAEFKVNFFGFISYFALGINACSTFYLATGIRTGLLASSIKVTCDPDTNGLILSDYNSADCDESTLNDDYSLNINDSGTIYGSTLGLPAKLVNFNGCGSDDDSSSSDSSEISDDCVVTSLQQYFIGPCDTFGDKGNTPDFVGTISLIDGYCNSDGFNGISLYHDCEAQTIRFYDNLICDDNDGLLFENKYVDTAQCIAQGPSAQNGGYNESSVYTCDAQVTSASDSSSSSD